VGIACPHRKVPLLRTRSRSIAVALALAGLSSATPASAAPSIGELRSRVAQIEAEVGAIDDQVEDAAENYNGAVFRLGEINRRITRNRDLLRRSTVRLKRSQDQLAERLRAAYVAPQPNTVQIILSSGSVSSALTGVDAMRRLGDRDATIVRSVSALRRQRIATQEQLRKDRGAAEKEVAARARQRAAVTQLLARRQAVLASAKGRLATMLAAEEARRRREAEELQRRARRIASTPTAPAATPERGSDGSRSGGRESGGGATSPSAPAPTVSGGGSAANAQAAQIALRYLGVPYRWGGASPGGGFDCSGLASYAYAQVGKSVPHYTGAIWAKFPRVSGALAPGDLVFFRGLGHMGIYIGGGNMVHAPRTGDVVKVTAMSSRRDYVGAVRP
jgi:cell wall-associated NlpC family hydrolase